MSIWVMSYTMDDLNQRSKNTLVDFLGIQFIEMGDDTLTATMPVDTRTKQPIGILHGGANVVLAETIASTAANMVINLETHYCVGLEINANHIRSVDDGIVTGIAQPIHLGRTTQVWHVDIYDMNGKQTCISRMTAAVLSRDRV